MEIHLRINWRLESKFEFLKTKFTENEAQRNRVE
ncbi:unnamed protein product [Acanthoscelides obtectus]|uniref:Uncharacterized protein n=1 Tax=Acanthoscelides obtectus TaxID=200917 RepID=A0A9P0JT88_ACAOB|nr:unnamed protein product [Acanthoscelides obtectus]CAK1641385.1 hypothetical protein AOBTE_LOCUS12375 [Acanthoscelides obtectus]